MQDSIVSVEAYTLTFFSSLCSTLQRHNLTIFANIFFQESWKEIWSASLRSKSTQGEMPDIFRVNHAQWLFLNCQSRLFDDKNALTYLMNDPPAIRLFINWSMTRRSLHEECLAATRPRLVTDDSTDDSDVRRAHERIDHWSHTHTHTTSIVIELACRSTSAETYVRSDLKFVL